MPTPAADAVASTRTTPTSWCGRPIEQLLTHPENLLAMARDYLGVREGQMETERDQLGAIDTKIAKLERAIRDSVAEGLRAGIDPAVMADAASEIQQELDALTARRAQLLHWQAVNAEKSDRMRTLWDLAEVAHQRLHSP